MSIRTSGAAVALSLLAATLRGQTCEWPGFAPSTPYAVASDSTAVAAADFNGDGTTDLAVASAGTSTVVVLLATTPGVFGAGLTTPVLAAPFGIAAAHVDGNATLDLLVSNRDGDSVSVLSGNGDGTFTAASPVAVGDQPLAIAVGDFNRDGRADFAVANAGSGTVSVRFGDGAGGFLGTDLPAGSSPRDVTTGDFDRDGDLDLVVSNFTAGSVSLLRGDGTGGFGAPTAFTASAGALGLANGDFDRDGRLDVAVSGFTGNAIAVLLGDGAGGFAAPIAIPVPGQPRGLAAVHLDADGRLDLAVANASGDAVEILIGNGDGSFSSGTPVAVGDLPNQLAAVDLDRDGRADLAVVDQASGTVSVARSLVGPACSRQSFPGVQAFLVASFSMLVAAGDFDNDGAADVLGFDQAGGLVFVRGDGSGQFTATGPLSIVEDARDLKAADLDGDGDLDAVATHTQENLVSVFRNLGNAHFVRQTFSTVGSGPQGIEIADLNGDGVPDLAVTNNITGSLVTFRGLGNGTFAPGVSLAVGLSPDAIVAADFNGDGRTDLAIGDRALAPTRVVVLLGDGAGAFGTPLAFDVDVYPTSIAASDWGGDGVPDLAVADYSGSRLKIYPGHGDGTFGDGVVVPLPGVAYRLDAVNLDADAEAELLVTGFEARVTVVDGNLLRGFDAADYRVASFAWSASIADFDGDGAPDLAVGDSGAFTMLRNDGSGAFPEPSGILLPGPVSTLASADLDRDGRVDLLVGHGQQVSAMLGNGFGGFGPLVATPLGFTPAATVLQDLNGDGKLDLLASDPGGRLVASSGLGTGAFGALAPHTTGAGAKGIAVADFDRDGWPDVAVANSAAATVSILLNDGAGGFTSLAPLPGPEGPARVATGDFDRDGIVDLAVTHSPVTFGGSVSIWKGQGDGTFVQTTVLAAHPFPDAIEASDLNGDGKTDLSVLCRNMQFPVPRHFLGDGTGGFTEISSPGAYAGVGQPEDMLLADLDADGRLDRLIVNRSSNLSIGRGSGDGAFLSSQNFIVGARPGALAAADFDRDGRLDVAVANFDDSTILVLPSTRCRPRRLRVQRNVSSCDQPTVPFAVQPQVAAVDDGGNVAACAGGTVAASLLPSGPAVLLGQSTANLVAGVAEFTDLTVDRPVSGHRLAFDSPTLPRTRSGSFAQGLTVSIAGPSPVVPGTVPVYHAGSGYERYEWSLDGGGVFSILPSVALPGLTLGAHPLRVNVRKDTCSAMATRTVEVVPPPLVSIDDLTTVEGDKDAHSAALTVRLSAALGQAVSVPFATVGGSAVPGSDFVSGQGTLVIPPDTTSADLEVVVKGDLVPEQDEAFLVELGQPENGTLGDGQAVATIANDDAPGPLAPGRELVHGSMVEGELAAWGSVADRDWYRLAQAPLASYEVVLDGASGDIAGPAPELARTTADGSVVLQQSLPVGGGAARSLRWRNTSTEAATGERILVASTGCQGDCGPDDRYRLRAYETTLAAPRFNNTGSQVSVVILQNSGSDPVSGLIDFRDAGGAQLHAHDFAIAPHGTLVLGTAGIPALSGTSGSLTVSHDAPYGLLVGKVVLVEPASGLAFDTPVQSRAR
jgi:FG-GAP-like repeat/Calx-beta domain/FG-GAP repeat